MEGLEISEVMLSVAKSSIDDFRIHSEFFKKEFISNENKLLSIDSSPMNSFAKVSDGDHAKFPDNQKEEIRYLQARDINNNFLEITSNSFVSESYLEKNKRSKISGEDILISKMGTVGDITILPKDFKPAMCNRALAIIKNVKGISPQYLFTYLTSRIATLELERLKNGGVQQRLNLDVLGKVRIPKLDENFQKEIETLIFKTQEIRNQSKSTYTQAEQLLLQELNLANFQPSQEPVNVKNFSESFDSSGRLDAEYYQVKYDELEGKIKSSSFVSIKEIRTDNFRGLQPKYVQDGNLDIINSKHILEQALDYDNFEKTSSAYWDEQERARVFKNDILTYTTGANIGRTQVYLIDKKALASNHVNILRLKTGYNSQYIGFVMNSIIGRLQTEKLSAGSAQAELYPKDIDNFLIPIIDQDKQQQIAELVEESLNLKKQSEHLLEVAKQAVEMAIEQDEERAMRWIKEQTKDRGRVS